MCSTHCTSEEADAEFCDEVPQDHSRHINPQEEKRNTAIRKLAKQQRISSVLTKKRLCVLGHMEHMKDEHVSKKLLVCALNTANELLEASVSDGAM